MTAGAVLCGGASRRMGTDKALVEVDGVPMAERVARALEAGGCHPVLLVGGDPVNLGPLGRPLVADAYPGAGPAGGVLTALDALDEDVVVVAACDIPLLDGATVAALASAVVADHAVDAAVAVADGWQQSLTSWRRRARPRLEERWQSGYRALHDFLDGVPHVEVPVAPDAVRNVNTPEERSGAERMTR